MSNCTLALSWLFSPVELDILSTHFNSISQLCKQGKNLLHLDVVIQYDSDYFTESEILDSLQQFKGQQNTRIFLLQGIGVSKSRNFAIQHCSTELIHFIDLDFQILDLELYYMTVSQTLHGLSCLAFLYPPSFSLSKYSIWNRLYLMTNRRFLLSSTV